MFSYMKMRRHWHTKAILLGFAGFVVLVTCRIMTRSKCQECDINELMRTVKEFNIKRSHLSKYLLKPHGKDKCMEIKDKHNSQTGQDEVVFEILHKKGGFFLKIGASDGQYLSSTFLLEKRHDWTGLLIESNPNLCKKIDKFERNVWRLCACLSKSHNSVSFNKGDDIKRRKKMLNQNNNKITVPCFSLEEVLDAISVHHIDFVYINTKDIEMSILETMKSGLKYGTFTVDVWSIEYRVWDGNQMDIVKSKKNLNTLRKYFNEIGGYFEYSLVTTGKNIKDRWAQDVLYVRIGEWCKTRENFPNGTACPKKETAYGIDNYLLRPFPYQKVKDADKRHSQAKQDEVVFDIFQKEGGFFVDIGAHDGQFLSNTLWLERQHLWTGLLIEANPDLCQKIDKLKRHAWRLCACLSSTLGSVTFIKGDTVGGVENHIDEHHMKMVNKGDKITVPCYNLESVLDEIKIYHIDFFSLDVEGAEMAVLESLRDGLESNSFTVDVWSIEYRVWDGKLVVYEKSLENLNSLRWYFLSIGGYSEHSQLSNDENFSDGYALDVVFVRNKKFCEKYDELPDGTKCSDLPK
eukprot:XP_011448405.1 PREDICTED: uncharacterized protein LOC105342971 isoform X1 [Crassostrea gigas]